MINKFLRLYRHFYKLPKSVRIEFCSNCCLNCLDCYMRKDSSNQIIGSGFLSFDNFKKFIKKNPYITSVETSLSGEIFLNPDFIKIIQFAHHNNIKLTAFNGVNFNSVSDEILLSLVKHKFTGITFSIDGASDKTYPIYRRNGNFNKVIDNIQKLNSLKKQYNSKFPILVWQFIIFEHNKHEINMAFDLAKKLNFSSIYYKLPWKNSDYTYDEMKLLHLANKHFIPISDKEIIAILRENNTPLCFQPWIQPQINWDGRLLGCCCSTCHDLGVNVFSLGLKKALASKNMIKMKDILLGKISSSPDFACHHCGFYNQMKNANKFINSNWFNF